MLNCHYGAGHLKSRRGHSRRRYLLRRQTRREGVSSQPPPTGSLGSHRLALPPECDCKLQGLLGLGATPAMLSESGAHGRAAP